MYAGAELGGAAVCSALSKQSNTRHWWQVEGCHGGGAMHVVQCLRLGMLCRQGRQRGGGGGGGDEALPQVVDQREAHIAQPGIPHQAAAWTF